MLTNIATIKRFPYIALFISLTLSITIPIGLKLDGLANEKQKDELHELSNRIYQLLGLVQLHDEALTMSTQAALHDEQNLAHWRQRYADFEPVYYASLEELYTLAPALAVKHYQLETKRSSDILQDAEVRAFANLDQGEYALARAQLSSPEYIQAKRDLYAEGERFSAALITYLDERELAQNERYQLSNAFAALGLMILLLAWYFLFLTLRQWYKKIQEVSRAQAASNVELNETLGLLKIELDARLVAETELRLREQALQRSNEELEKFAFVASHDLQEPLRKVQAFGDRLSDKYAEHLDDKGQDYLNRMQAAATRMRSLIQDLLLFSRVASQGRSFAPVDLQSALDGVLSDLEVLIHESGVHLHVESLPTIDADKLQMRQVLQNIIGNAIKYRSLERSPEVTVSSEICQIEGEEFCVLRVSDNGIGFEKQYAHRIFEVFQRLHGRNSYSGTGIGLAIVRRIVERHGGTITADAEPDQGAVFTITLPCVHEKEHEDENKKEKLTS